jgi:histone H3/H4
MYKGLKVILQTIKMEHITKPSITRLARRAGVKSMSDDCYSTVYNLAESFLSEVVSASLIVNSEHNTKTLMSVDVYEALRLKGYNIAQSNDLGTATCTK